MTCKNCIHYEMCLPRVAVGGDIICQYFKDKSKMVELPFVAMVEQHLVNGKFVNSNIQNKNGIYAVVYVDKSKWGTPLIDICGKKPYDKQEAEARIIELNSSRQ